MRYFTRSTSFNVKDDAEFQKALVEHKADRYIKYSRNSYRVLAHEDIVIVDENENVEDYHYLYDLIKKHLSEDEEVFVKDIMILDDGDIEGTMFKITGYAVAQVDCFEVSLEILNAEDM